MEVSEEIPLIVSWPAGTVAFFDGEVIPSNPQEIQNTQENPLPTEK